MRVLSTLLAVVLILLTPMVLCASMSRSFADWRISANDTVQVRVSETQATERTRIEWNARTEIAAIEADATKKTDGTFILFYLVRATMWAAGVVWVVVGAAWAVKHGSRLKRL